MEDDRRSRRQHSGLELDRRRQVMQSSSPDPSCRNEPKSPCPRLHLRQHPPDREHRSSASPRRAPAGTMSASTSTARSRQDRQAARPGPRGLPRIRSRQGEGRGRRRGHWHPRRTHEPVRRQVMVDLRPGRLVVEGDGRDGLEIAVCSSPGVAGSRPPRVIGPTATA